MQSSFINRDLNVILLNFHEADVGFHDLRKQILSEVKSWRLARAWLGSCLEAEHKNV